MKHAMAVMVLAGMAGGAAWYHNDEASQKPLVKLQVPDPGLDDDELTASAPEWEPLDVQLSAPVNELPQHLIAERTPAVKTISESDEQPFAVSDEDEEDAPPARKPVVRRSDAFEPVETQAKPQQPQRPNRHRAEADQSAEGRAINVRRFGQGAYRTLIITGLDGRDRTGVQWADELADVLETRADLLQQQEFVIIRAANPDGLAAMTRENAHGVDLNRNFPTRRFRPTESPSSGIGPASEPETRALLQAMYEFRPQRIVHLISTTGKSGVFINQQARDVAERLQRHYSLPVQQMNYDQLPGSVEEFSDATWSSSVVRLHLHGVSEEEVARKLMPIVVTAVSQRDAGTNRGAATTPVSTPRKEPSRWQSSPASSPVPPPTDRNRRPVLRRGYEELPPPPQ